MLRNVWRSQTMQTRGRNHGFLLNLIYEEFITSTQITMQFNSAQLFV